MNLIVSTGNAHLVKLIEEALQDPEEDGKAFLAAYVLQIDALQSIAKSLEKLSTSVGSVPYDGNTIVEALHNIALHF